MNKFLIGISGKMGSGKTTMSQMILDGAPMQGERIAVASPIYDVVDLIYNRLDIKLEGDKDRDLMISLGLWGRNRDPNFWLDQFTRKVESSNCKLIVCDDIRFPNEANYFEQHGILIRLKGEQRGANVDSNIQNLTETALDEYPFDHYVDNSYGIEDTFEQILDIILRSKNENML